MSLIEPREAKQAMRVLMRVSRARPGTDTDALADALLALPLPDGLVVAGVAPLPGEPDLMPAWDALHRRGAVVVLPETSARGEPLSFRQWRPGDVLLPGRFGTRHPDGPIMAPDIVFVPLLAWDRRMFRLGYGGGYYDRTLAALPHALAIGFGYSFQEVAAVPTGPYDVSLSAVVTERGLATAEGQDFADIVSGRHRRAKRP